VRAACAAIAAVLLTAARALDGDPLSLEEWDALGLPALCFALAAAWPREGAARAEPAGTPAADEARSPRRAALNALCAWSLLALIAYGPAARMLIDGGRAWQAVLGWALALALAPAVFEAGAVLGSGSARGARLQSWAWAALIAGPLLVHYGLAFGAASEGAATSGVVSETLAWLADATPLGLALRACAPATAAAGPATLLVPTALLALAWLACAAASAAGRAAPAGEAR